jgi:hypothetical protein
MTSGRRKSNKLFKIFRALLEIEFNVLKKVNVNFTVATTQQSLYYLQHMSYRKTLFHII